MTSSISHLLALPSVLARLNKQEGRRRTLAGGTLYRRQLDTTVQLEPVGDKLSRWGRLMSAQEKIIVYLMGGLRESRNDARRLDGLEDRRSVTSRCSRIR